MYELEQKIYFFGFLVIPLLIISFLLYTIWRRKTQLAFSDAHLLERLAVNKSKTKLILKLILISIFFGFLVFALINLKIGTKLETVKREGVDVVFALDVSKSMDVEDIAPSRIEKAKRLISESIKKLVGDRVGIIIYAAQSFPQLPITTDYSAAELFLSSINTDMMSSQGTAINEAIDLASTFYNDKDQTNRVLFIISDGEDHSESVDEAIEKAVEKGIKIYTIGVGTPKGGAIPVKNSNNIVETYKKNSKGDVVISRFNESILRNIAQKGNGSYISGIDTKKAISHIEDILKNTEKVSFDTKQFSDYKSQFQWFIAIAIVFLILDILTLERKSWALKLNLFNEDKSKKLTK